MTNKVNVMLTVLTKIAVQQEGLQTKGKKSIECSEWFWSWQPKVLIVSEEAGGSGLWWKRGKSGAQSIHE